MKIRNGFVSNSSSSSFILGYSKNNVLTDPKEIIELIKNQPSKPILLRGWDLGEGDDIFKLSEEQKSLIRRFPKAFIDTNSGTETKESYSYSEEEEEYIPTGEETVPKIEVFTDYILKRNPRDDFGFDVDMSDIPKPDFRNIMCKPENQMTEEEKKQADQLNAWYKEKDRRTKLQCKQEFEKISSEIKTELSKKGYDDIDVKEIFISNRSCDDDFYYSEEFAQRYLTTEDADNYDSEYFQVKKYKPGAARPFIISYSEAITDKNEIIDVLTHSDLCNYIICFTNPTLNSRYDDEIQYDFFKIGKFEKDTLIAHKDIFYSCNREVVMFTDAKILKDTEKFTSSQGKVLVPCFGKVNIIEPSQDLVDFEKQFREIE